MGIHHPKESIYQRKDNGERILAIFLVGNEWYCIDIHSIFEVLHDFEITSASHLPPFYEGIVNLRGESIPVVVLRKLLDLQSGISNTQVCIISVINNAKLGFLIDSEPEFVKFSDIQSFSLPNCYTSDEQKFLEGIIEHKNRLIGILKFEQAMNILTTGYEVK